MMWPFGIKTKDIVVDYEKLAEAIVAAQEKCEVKKREKVEEDRQEILAKRKEILKEKDFSHIKFSIWREIRVFFNNIKVMWNLLTLSREDAKYFAAVRGLAKLLSSLLLYSISVVFYFFSFAALYNFISNAAFSEKYIIFFFVSIVLARIVRLARFEVERMENQAELMNVTMFLIALITLVATIIGIVLNSGGNRGII